jgi:hypothetical protein
VFEDEKKSPRMDAFHTFIHIHPSGLKLPIHNAVSLLWTTTAGNVFMVTSKKTFTFWAK